MKFPECGKFFSRTLLWSFLLFGIVECLAVTTASANPLPQIPNTAPTKAPAPPAPAAPSAAQATKQPPVAAPAVVATTTDGPSSDTPSPYSDNSGGQNKPHGNDHSNLGSTHAPFAPWDTFFRPQNNTPHQKPFQITWVPLGQLIFNGFQKLFQPNHNENNHFDNHHG